MTCTRAKLILHVPGGNTCYVTRSGERAETTPTCAPAGRNTNRDNFSENSTRTEKIGQVNIMHEWHNIDYHFKQIYEHSLRLWTQRKERRRWMTNLNDLSQIIKKKKNHRIIFSHTMDSQECKTDRRGRSTETQRNHRRIVSTNARDIIFNNFVQRFSREASQRTILYDRYLYEIKHSYYVCTKGCAHVDVLQLCRCYVVVVVYCCTFRRPTVNRVST